MGADEQLDELAALDEMAEGLAASFLRVARRMHDQAELVRRQREEIARAAEQVKAGSRVTNVRQIRTALFDCRSLAERIAAACRPNGPSLN